MTALTVSGVALAAIALNLPFGAWRTTVQRYSWRWFLAIHLPIPFIFLMRRASGLSWHWVPLMFACALVGQLAGSWLYVRLPRRDARQAPPDGRPPSP
jgi:hypothetical protein